MLFLRRFDLCVNIFHRLLHSPAQKQNVLRSCDVMWLLLNTHYVSLRMKHERQFSDHSVVAHMMVEASELHEATNTVITVV